MKVIGSSAFGRCAELSTVTFANGLTVVGGFKNCPKLTSITIPSSVTTINAEAFSGCPLTSLTFTSPSSVTSIGGHAFSGCLLTSVTLPASLTSISGGAFYNCPNLHTATFQEGATAIGGFAGCRNLTTVKTPKTAKNIVVSAFENCSKLISINIPASVTKIGYGAFAYSGLTSITIPEGVTIIDNGIFSGCTTLTSVIIPQSVIAINADAFRECKSLSAIALPKNLITIGSYCFQSCSALKSVTFSERLLSIGSNSFYKCDALTSVTIPKGVMLGDLAFGDCSALTSVTLLEGVTFNSSSTYFITFSGCSKLDTIINFSEKPQVIFGKKVFENISPTATLLVPFRLLSIYRASPVWQDFSIATYKGLITMEDFSCAKDSSVTYDGSPHGVGSIALNPAFADVCSISKIYYTGAGYAKTTELPTSAGTYAVSADIAYKAGAGFRDTSVVVGTFAIRKATPTAAHFSLTADSGLTCSYNGLPHAIKATLKDSRHSGLGSMTPKYNGRSTGSPVSANVYDITVNITEGANFSAISDLWLGTLTINKITPAAAHLTFAPDSSVVYSGRPHALPVSPKEGRYDGMGAITVKYNGNVTLPIGAGKYDVSADIADGVNFGRAVGLSLGTLAICYSVTFESSGGSAVAAQKVLPGGAAARPANPTKAQHTFAGWYADEGLTALWSFAADTVAGNMTLYARWFGAGTITCTVSFESNGGSAVDPQTVAIGDTVVRPANPTKAGHIFAGWYADAGLTARWSFPTEKATGSRTLYAKWVDAGTATCTVSFSCNGGSAVNTQQVAPGGTVARPRDPTKAGCTFDGWYADARLTAPWNFSTGKVNGNMTLYAGWIVGRAITYTVSFNSSGGSSVAPQTVEVGSKVECPTNPTKPGYTFTEWHEDSAENAPWVFPIRKVYENVTLYASWTLIPIKLDSIAFNGAPQEVNDTIEFAIPCGADEKRIEVKYFYASNASTLYVDATRPFLIDTAITITDNGQSRQYTLRIKKRFEFSSIVHVKLGGKLLVIVRNPENNGGFSFQEVAWRHKSGARANSNKYYYTSPSGGVITDTLYVKLLDASGTWLETCPYSPPAAAAAPQALRMAVYPNPVSGGSAIHLKDVFGDDPEERYEVFYLIDIQGKVIYAGETSELRQGLTMPGVAGIYHLVLEGKAGRTLIKVAVGK